ncbi:hypothetical protein KA005_44465, partial [bacterium]|nr:hypothetical protein [bacterium]
LSNETGIEWDGKENKMKIIFCPTVPQSGTWFVLRLFERLGCKIMDSTRVKKEGVQSELSILHTHIFPFYYNPAPYKESWPSFGGDPIQEYIVRKNKLSIGCIKLLSSMYKTIIPIRDPLASLLTREARAPNLRHFYIVDGYVEIARELANYPNVKFFPIDLNLSFDERKKLLVDVVTHCGFDAVQYDVLLGDIATHWKKENVTPNNRFHEPYEKGDLDTIQKWLGPKWAEVVHLKNMGGILIPFLSALGYNEKKTLIW